MNNLEGLKYSGDVGEKYPYLVRDVMEYIEFIKKSGDDSALLDIIMDYCHKKDVEVEMVGDAISSDIYFKAFIEKDCELHNIIRNPNKSIEEW